MSYYFKEISFYLLKPCSIWDNFPSQGFPIASKDHFPFILTKSAKWNTLTPFPLSVILYLHKSILVSELTNHTYRN